ncbi:MAG: UDP-3-O-acyl-N-acetylglucosamine deacetylase [Deltaproteobacteria bacterium]|nr:UDP-3-O-acyl-N-acetylglucosamine deacetylase [Deltaproteobacteria bacterium]MBW2051238.1 UDP-3-O-acyl-N-acetylglucosamine deacetylase [Deltaproteobacteria bacterium]MBW2141159.1 UDP-3-O-acyl-N-acetylglucosamine deacetylase [Deltaproteobacteria bacterium]MBW2322647.1 UDP-3-O-acyl-N-acetylglucosamine deacetylase [Deltaproteobacteria bacterium]
MLTQRTLKRSISCIGIGLHTGDKVHMTMHPAPEDSGITFVRTDISGRPVIKASLENVVHTRRATTLGVNGITLSTVEHLLSAFTGLGVDNVMVEVDSVEIPIMDGSAAPFVFLIKTAGLKKQNRPKKFYVIEQSIFVSDQDKYLSLEPAQELVIDFSINFDHPLLESQSYQVNLSRKIFEKEISRARTFGFLQEVEYLKKNGLARGGSLDNAIVIDHFRVLNEGGLRYEDEFVRHKILDLIGDVSLMGSPVIGRFKAHKSGHTLNHSLLARLMETPEAWRRMTAADLFQPTEFYQPEAARVTA